MDDDVKSLQNEFFNAARKDRSTVTVFLSNGKKLVGRIRAFDKFTVLLESQLGQQIVFKHAVATLTTSPRVAAADEGARDGHPSAGRSDEPDEG